MTPEESQKLSRKYSRGQKWKDEPQGIHTDEQESKRTRLSAACHQQHTGESRANARSPGKTEGKSHDESRNRRHRHLFQPERYTVFSAQQFRATKHAKLIQAEENDQYSPDPGKQHPLLTEKAAGRRCAQTEDEKGRADPDRKTQYSEKES